MAGKILVPVDFSIHTPASCQYAISLAIRLNKDIVLFHSFFDQIYFSDGGFATGFESGILLTDDIIVDIYKQKEARLREIEKEMNAIVQQQGGSPVKVTGRMETGDPEVRILNAISAIRPDTIVMGSSGMGKKGLFTGSVARRIMDHTNIPVFAVPKAEELPDIRNVAYMTNFDPSDAEIIFDLDNFLSPVKCTIWCLNLCQERNEDEARSNMQRLSDRELPLRKETKINHQVIAGSDPRQSLHDFIRENRIDLLAFIPHKRNVFKNFNRQNLTKEDLFQADIPILAIPVRS